MMLEGMPEMLKTALYNHSHANFSCLMDLICRLIIATQAISDYTILPASNNRAEPLQRVIGNVAAKATYGRNNYTSSTCLPDEDTIATLDRRQDYSMLLSREPEP